MRHWQRAALALLNRRRWQHVTDGELVGRARVQRAAMVDELGEDAVTELEREWRAEHDAQAERD